MYEAIRVSLQALAYALSEIEDARIVWPSDIRRAELAALGTQRCPELPGCFGFIDGTALWIPQPSNPDEARAYYNYKHHHPSINNVLCFGTDGTIIWACTNAPGSWNDSKLADGFYTKISHLPRHCGHFIVADSAFAPQTRRGLTGKILKPVPPSKQSLVTPERKIQSARICGLRAAAEWGMGSLKAQFRRLRHFLPADRSVRRVILYCVVRLFNLRVRAEVRKNHIANVFDPAFLNCSRERDANMQRFVDRTL